MGQAGSSFFWPGKDPEAQGAGKVGLSPFIVPFQLTDVSSDTRKSAPAVRSERRQVGIQLACIHSRRLWFFHGLL